MRTIKASEFKTKCLKIMDEVEATGEPVIITKHGRAVARLSAEPARRRSLFGRHKGQIEILGDIISPIDEVWEAER